MMTRWEAEERARPDAGGDRPEGWDEEWVGTIVKAPVEEIVLDLVLPESLASVTRYVRCECSRTAFLPMKSTRAVTMQRWLPRRNGMSILR